MYSFEIWIGWILFSEEKFSLTAFMFVEKLASWNQKQNTYEDNAALVSRPRSSGGEM
jgi:hypothetical protein